MLKFYEVSCSVDNEMRVYRSIMIIAAPNEERARELVREKFKQSLIWDILIQEYPIKEGTYFLQP